MKRSEKIIVDLKTKNYDEIRLKQLDTTELEFKILDNSIDVDLSAITSADIVFSRPDKTIVIQECTIDSENNTIKVVLLENCLRVYGKAKIEVELKENTEVVSTFHINVFIERTSKEDVTAENAQTYIERLENIISELETEAEQLLTDIENEADEKIEDIETRYTTLTNTINTLVANYQELVEYVEEITDSVGTIVDSQMNDYLLKRVDVSTVTIPANTTITNGYEITLPIQYQVGNNSLELRLDSEVLKLASETADGHYKEVGAAGAKSNKIQFYRTEADGSWTLEEAALLTAIVRGVSQESEQESEVQS